MPGHIAPSEGAPASTAVSAQGRRDPLALNRLQYGGTAQVPLSFAGEPSGQVAGAGTAVLDFAVGCQTKTLLGSLVGFLLWHDWRHTLSRVVKG